MITLKQFSTLENELNFCEEEENLTEESFVNRNLRKKHREEIHPIHNDLIKHYQQYQPNHLNALKQYTNRSVDLNLYNKNRKKLETKTPIHPEYEEMNQNLDSALYQHKTPHDIHVYTGLTRHPKYFHKKSGFSHPTYMSTSLNKHVAYDFAHAHHYDYDRSNDKNVQYTSKGNKYITHLHILHIHVPKNHPGAYVGHIATHNYKAQKEFILPRNTKLKINPNPETHIKRTIYQKYNPKWNWSPKTIAQSKGKFAKTSEEHVHIWHAHIES